MVLPSGWVRDQAAIIVIHDPTMTTVILFMSLHSENGK